MEVDAARPERVQSLVDAGIAHIPARYIQPLETRPSSLPSPPALHLPVIDLQDFQPSHRSAILRAVSAACAEWGAFQVFNHGIPPPLLSAVRGAGLGFFRDTPAPERLRYACDPTAPASEGYGSRMLSRDDGVLDWRDYFDHHTLPRSRRDPSRWPASPEGYREVVAEYCDQACLLARKLLGLMSEGLGLKESYIEEVVGDVHQNITICYYPPCPQPELALGLQAHSDFGAVTLLVQDDVGGLEVLKGDQWVLAEPIPDAVIVIVADQTEIISNGRYKSAVHRAVVNAKQARLSVATFHDPPKTAEISPAAELITDHSPQKYRGVVYSDYVSSWYSSGPEGKRNIDVLRL